MKPEDERIKLFNEVWSEPVTTVAGRYGVSDNGLRKRCIKLEIPLPPIGYWAKLRAGQKVLPKPKLPVIKVKHPAIVLKDAKQEYEMEFIDIGSESIETMKSLSGLGMLTPRSQEDFAKWCRKIQVPKKVDPYHPLIVEYQKEIEYRKIRDKEHKFREEFRFSAISLHSKVEYRDNKLVLPISVSDKQSQRAFRIIDTLIKAIEDLGGKVTVEKACYRSVEAKDNATMTVFQSLFSFQAREIMSKRRDVLANITAENRPREFRPMYEKVFTNILEIEFKQVPASWVEDKTGQIYTFKDLAELPLEDQLGEMIKSMFKASQEAKIDRFIREREEEEKRREREHLREIEQEKQNKLQALIAQEKRQKQLVANIQPQMTSWLKAQRLRRYAEELEAYALTMGDEASKELLTGYVTLVRQAAENCDPLQDILNEVKGIGITN